MWTRVHYLPIALLFFSSASALADYKADVGYSRLLAELGAATPDGAGVPVTQVEAETGDPPVYMPNVDDAQFTGKNITDVTGTNPLDSYSGHATGVGRNYFGNSSSIAPAINTIKAYNAGYWLGGNYLRATQGRFKPAEIPDRVANHSWVGNDPDDAVDLDILKRVDWVVDQDEFIQAVGLTNGTSTNPPLLSAAFNVIAVGVTDGQHGKSTVSLDPTYAAGRTRPNLVTPFTTTSSATPIVAAAAALLVEQGNSTPSLSTDPVESSTTNRAGATVYNAGRSEVVKVVLMAGADRVTDNSTTPTPIHQRILLIIEWIPLTSLQMALINDLVRASSTFTTAITFSPQANRTALRTISAVAAVSAHTGLIMIPRLAVRAMLAAVMKRVPIIFQPARARSC